ncbi:ABC transporter permease [Cellulomonas sp. KRMCY2]|uniref:ABC transporter permease n=1 Tax=Cellulomonas sp. KRMCY2 TaxID=1304865 RepID=UPI00045E99A7|nr:ABC transporter permease [Cellulomonas sp. KRMCY2]
MNRDAGILLRQVGHELAMLRRTPITMILSIGFPLLFFVLIAALVGNQTLDERNGVRLAQFLAPGFASFGVVMATFSFLAVGFAEARSTGVLKRQNGTPLPRWALLGGRIGAALLLGVLATAVVVTAGVVLYDVQLFSRSILAVVVTLVLSAVTFSALGLALAVLLPTPQATLAVTNGIVIPISFFSDIFLFGGEMPGWMSTVGWLFPLKHLVNVFADALNPYLTGNGFQLDHLAVIVAWGVAGALVAAWGLRRERDRVTTTARASARRTPAADAAPRRTASPSALALMGGQVKHTSTVLWRDASSVFFAVIFPVLLVAIIPTVNGGGDVVLDNGQLLGGFFAATMAVYGAAVTAYVNMPQGLAEARDRGVLKRVHGSPLPAWALLVGRVAGTLVVAVLTLVAMYLVAGLMYGTGIPPAWPGALLTFLLATTCFAVLGLAVMSLIRSAEAVIGVTLGTLLPLCFISDVFVYGADFPPLLDRISWFFPLRHATGAMTTAAANDVVGSGLSWDHLGALLAWTVVGLVVVAWRFSWVDLEPSRRRRSVGRAPVR